MKKIPEMNEVGLPVDLNPRVLGDKLKVARKARGLTQEEVAQELGIVRTTLVAIEKGTRKVTSLELVEMAKMYGRPISDFVSKQSNTEPFIPQFRSPHSHAGVDQGKLSSAILELESIAKDYVELERINGARMKPQYPQEYLLNIPGVTPGQRGEEVAAIERDRLGLGDGPILGLRSFLEQAVGIRIFYIPLPPKVGGLFGYNDVLGACIAINILHPPPRGNWSLAHEYGHFLTTRYLADVDLVQDHWGKLVAEKFADSFARNFLMPRQGITRKLSETAGANERGAVTIADVLTLADLYGVSAEAMFRRLEELKRIPHGKWDELRSQRGFQPEKAREALGMVSHTREPMLPLRYRLLATNAYKKELLTEGQFARKLRMERIEARMEMETLNALIDDPGDFKDQQFHTLDFDMSTTVIAK